VLTVRAFWLAGFPLLEAVLVALFGMLHINMSVEASRISSQAALMQAGTPFGARSHA
jgi:hypothetical protein